LYLQWSPPLPIDIIANGFQRPLWIRLEERRIYRDFPKGPVSFSPRETTNLELVFLVPGKQVVDSKASDIVFEALLPGERNTQVPRERFTLAGKCFFKSPQSRDQVVVTLGIGVSSGIMQQRGHSQGANEGVSVGTCS